MKNKNKIIIIIVAIFVVSGLLTLTSFAYFSASVQGNDSAYNTVITTGEMTLMLNDGEQVGLNNAIPGNSITKEFSVKNTGTVETTYDVYFSELLNEFEDKNDLVYTLTSENGCADSNEKIVPSVSSNQSKIVSACTINPNQTHSYILTITFKDDGTNQDDNKGKRFSTKISINEYKEYQYIAKLIDGQSFNGLIKSLTVNEDEYNEFASVALTENGYFSLEHDNYCADKQEKCEFLKSVFDARRSNYLYLVDGTYIKNIEIINEIPQNTNAMTLVSSNDSYYDIYVRYDNETIYIYTDQDEIYLNEDSSYLFYKLNKIENLDLKKVNTSNVTNMPYIFYETTGGIEIDESFNTSNVVDMHGMFSYSKLDDYSFVNNLDTSKVTNMSYMFSGMEGRIELDERFNTSNVVDMSWMFYDSKLNDYSFVNSFDVSNVTNMYGMFYGAGEGVELKLNDFNASNVTNMHSMFSDSKFTSIDLGKNFNAKSVEDMQSMFEDSDANYIYLGDNFNAKNSNNMSYMFNSNENTEIVDLGDNFNAEKNANVFRMFSNAGKHLNLGKNFNGSNITNMSGMFYYFYGNILNLGENFDTSSVTDMSQMFRGCNNLESLDLGDNFDTLNVIKMDTMFAFSYKLKAIYLGDKFYVSKDADVNRMFDTNNLEKIYVGKNVFFDFDNTNNSSDVFGIQYKLVGGAGTTFDTNYRSIEYARIDDPEHGKPGYFTLDPRYQ